MTISLTKYTDVARPLTKEEVDGNWDALIDAISALQEGGMPQIVGINSEEDAGGQYLTFVFSDGTPTARIPFPAAIMQSGAWVDGATYTTRHIVTHDGGTYLCIVAHTSGEDFWEEFDGGKWLQLGSAAATAIDFAPGDSGLTATTMQEAIIELNDKIEGSNLTAAAISYDNAGSGLNSTLVQGAIDEIAARVTDLEGSSGGGGGSDDQTAAEVPFTPVSGTNSTNVQAALEDAFAAIEDLQDNAGGGTTTPTAAEVSFTPASGLSSTNVQAAIVEVKGLIGSGGSGPVTDLQVSFDGTLTNHVSGATNLREAIGTLDSELYNLADIVANFTVSGSQVMVSGGGSVDDALATLENSISTLQADNIGYTDQGHVNIRQALNEIFTRLETLEA
ncbi:carbohydrate-binding protein [Rhizobium leguminosarum]|uniref:carbohydrate-binding protein n=1 Tax=Rhizobium leguminosarum TaxID=384 RepID=UPI001442217C|nr:carbohydrate-binding protein [Rhizobium leguminosarum]NKJ77766.1 hypothetical protein [Rhizobium leguminosarum bv. viciae]